VHKLVSVKLDDLAIGKLNVIGNTVVSIESDGNDHGRLFGSFWYSRPHGLGHKNKVRLRIFANTSSCDDGAGIQIEATWCARKLNFEGNDAIQKVGLDSVDTCVLLNNLMCSLLNERGSQVSELADTLIGCRRKVDFCGIWTLNEAARIHRLPSSVQLRVWFHLNGWNLHLGWSIEDTHKAQTNRSD
jgi:hypothetical protein